jgi:dimethylamine/trimethylamine dehydrogenase
LPDLWDVNVSPWQFDSGTARFDAEGWQEPYIDLVKKLTTKPVVGVGRFTAADAMVCLKCAAASSISLAPLGRSIADPDLPEKIRNGRIDEVGGCIGCNVWASTAMYGVPIRCTQIATIGEEWRKGWHPEVIPVHIARESSLVVGAGPTRMEAALTLARRGLEVSLFKATSELGGRITWESRLPGCRTYDRVREHRVYQLERMSNVQVVRESPLDAGNVIEFGAKCFPGNRFAMANRRLLFVESARNPWHCDEFFALVARGGGARPVLAATPPMAL